ncbi:uncharacterized protein V6R79_004782 [Siganus canaliculatus]
MEDGENFSLCGKAAVTEANLRDEYYWKLVADFIGPQSGEGLELEAAPCKNRLLIQVGLLKEDNNFPWLAIVNWLKKIFPRHQTADFRRLIERGIATTLSLGLDARSAFLESEAHFNFVGPICDSIGVDRQHLLEMKDFSEQAQSIEVTNGLILELSNFITREKLAPIVLVTWLRNFNSEFCKDGDIQKAFKVLRVKIKRLKLSYRNYETRSHRRNAMMESLLQSPFELVRRKAPKIMVKKRMRRDDTLNYEKVTIKEEYESDDMQGEEAEVNRESGTENDLNTSENAEETSDTKGEALALLDIAMLSVQKLSSIYGGKNEACRQVSLDLLKNQYTLMCKEHPAMAEFETKVNSFCENNSLVTPVVFLNYNANFLVDMQDAIEQQIINFEKEIVLSTGEKLGRDKLPHFKNFVNLSESATSRYIHMACNVLSPATPGTQNYRKYWVAFCEEKKNPSRLAVNLSNRFNNYFEAAAGLIHHHKEIALFLSDLLSLNDDTCPNIILESVAADANDSVIQNLVCVLAIIYCKILGPYWQLLKSGSEYSHFSQYLLCLYQRFLDWSKDPSTLLEPEEETNVFLQVPLQEKNFDGVFDYCGQWHTNRDLIRACLKRMVKVIAAVTEEHLKVFLPGGPFSQVPDMSLQLISCTFSVLMSEYPNGHAYPYEKKKPNRASKGSSQQRLLSDSSPEDEDQSGLSDTSSHHGQNEHSPKQRKGYRLKKENTVRVIEEERVENMDRDYIIGVVSRNGGPCKTKQDVDKMLLRFDGKPRAEKREALRCEILYQKMILNNTDPNLDSALAHRANMLLKLKLALPRVKPSYSLIWAPRKTKIKPVLKETMDASTDQTESTETQQPSLQEACCD